MSYLLINGIHEKRIDDFFEQKISNLDNDEIFVSYLNAEIEPGQTLGDIIILAHLSNEDKKLENKLESFLEKTYSTKVCWRLYKENKEWLRRNKCRKKLDLLDSTIIIPLPNKDMLKTRLHVIGYAK
jgi:hypothetical protein